MQTQAFQRIFNFQKPRKHKVTDSAEGIRIPSTKMPKKLATKRRNKS
jgi:hypothetical protein